MDKKLKSIIICPLCHSAFNETKDKLTCKKCKQEFKIKDEIPILVPYKKA